MTDKNNKYNMYIDDNSILVKGRIEKLMAKDWKDILSNVPDNFSVNFYLMMEDNHVHISELEFIKE